MACRWEGPSEDLDLALKCVTCSKAYQVDNVRHEYEMLKAARTWAGCIGGKGIFWEPWVGKDGARKGTKYYFGMTCAPSPASNALLCRGSFCDCVGQQLQVMLHWGWQSGIQLSCRLSMACDDEVANMHSVWRSCCVLPLAL